MEQIEYEVGDIWEISAERVADLILPHIENVVVYEKRRLDTANNSIGSIEQSMPPINGQPRQLYESLLQSTENGALYIAKQNGIPSYSTTFWRPDQPLLRDTEGKRVRYRYPTENGGHTFTLSVSKNRLKSFPQVRSYAFRWHIGGGQKLHQTQRNGATHNFPAGFSKTSLKRSIEMESSLPQTLFQAPLEFSKTFSGMDNSDHCRRKSSTTSSTGTMR